MVGTQIGNYRILEKIGEGGMGVVYKGVDVNLDRTVAIKALNTELGRNPQLEQRFRSEAKAQGNLNHANLATLYTLLIENGRPFMVMEFIEGETFEQMVRRRGPIPSEEAIPLFQQALLGIGYAHRMGVIHRDIKPANLMVNSQGIVKVMDFGLAKVLGARGVTRTGAQLGSAFYMSPEQVLNRGVDFRSDIYSLGITLYEVLTAHVPFSAENDYQVMADHVSAAPPRLTKFCPDIPKHVERAVLRAIEKKPDARYQSAEEFRTVLAESPLAISQGPVTTVLPAAAPPRQPAARPEARPQAHAAAAAHAPAPAPATVVMPAPAPATVVMPATAPATIAMPAPSPATVVMPAPAPATIAMAAPAPALASAPAPGFVFTRDRKIIAAAILAILVLAGVLLGTRLANKWPGPSAVSQSAATPAQSASAANATPANVSGENAPAPNVAAPNVANDAAAVPTPAAPVPLSAANAAVAVVPVQPAPPVSAAIAGPLVIPAGTVVAVRLIDPVDSSMNHVGDQFAASVDVPVNVGGVEAIPAGADATLALIYVEQAPVVKQTDVKLQLVNLAINGTDHRARSSVFEQLGLERGKHSAAKVFGGAAVGAVGGFFTGGTAKGAASGAAKAFVVVLPAETKINFTLRTAITIPQ